MVKKALPPRKTIIAKLDRLFANYIKKRDSGGGEYFKCISCGEIKPIKNADCGHYFSRRHMATRWDENNAHCECSRCNRFDSEHLHYYRKNLIEKIGEKALEELEWKSQQPIKFSDFELNEMYIHYGQLMKLLEREQKAAEKNYKRLQRKNFF